MAKYFSASSVSLLRPSALISILRAACLVIDNWCFGGFVLSADENENPKEGCPSVVAADANGFVDGGDPNTDCASVVEADENATGVDIGERE